MADFIDPSSEDSRTKYAPLCQDFVSRVILTSFPLYVFLNTAVPFVSVISTANDSPTIIVPTKVNSFPAGLG